MADIKVKPTKRTPLWLWLLLALGVAAAIGAYLAFGRGPDSAALTLLSF